MAAATYTYIVGPGAIVPCSGPWHTTSFNPVLGKGKRLTLTPHARFNALPVATKVNAPQQCHVQGPPMTQRQRQGQRSAAIERKIRRLLRIAGAQSQRPAANSIYSCFFRQFNEPQHTLEIFKVRWPAKSTPAERERNVRRARSASALQRWRQRDRVHLLRGSLSESVRVRGWRECWRLVDVLRLESRWGLCQNIN